MSSIEPCEEGETQLYIANSLEVRSDEICAESVLSADDMMRWSKAARVDAVDGNPSLHTVVGNQKDSGTVADSIHLCCHSHSRRHSSNQKSHCATSSGDATGFHRKSRSPNCHSITEVDASKKHTCSVQKCDFFHPDAVDNNSASCPLKQNDVLKSSSHVWFQYCFILLRCLY